MAGMQKLYNQGMNPMLPPEERLLTRYSWCCQQFRENDSENAFGQDGHPVAWLLREVMDMVAQFPQTRFIQGLQALAVRSFPVLSQAVFYCLCELFMNKPLVPVQSSSFTTDAANYAFHKGIDFLVGQGLVVAVAVNKSDESKATKDNYLLAPHVCRTLFRGREDLIRPTDIAQFGTLTLSKSIPAKDLILPDTLRDRLQLVSRAVAADQFDRVVAELSRHGMRCGVTVLLYGPPGTGKTEFVRQLARITGRNILQVDCAKLDASYYGEKPRNLRDFFRLAKYASAISFLVPIVFVDEADGLLGRRVQVEKAADKEENTTVNIILEELNTFAGILLAATNNIANIDPAMNRRFLVKVEFPVPDREVLTRIWRSKLPWLTIDEAETLAERFPLSGGVIDNVVSLSLLEKIVDGQYPSLKQISQHCEEQSDGSGKKARKIGF